ncbi:MAG: DUF6789 family protein [Gemmatimonadota bacterium]
MDTINGSPLGREPPGNVVRLAAGMQLEIALNSEADMDIRWQRAVAAGVVGTAVMTAVGVWGAPMMGLPRMNPAEMLAGPMGGSMVLGWVAHFMIGTILAVIYAAIANRLPGPGALSGALYGLAPWLLAQVVVMPMMGMPVFSGSAAMTMGSLVGHLIYGAIVGAVYGNKAIAGARVARAAA